MRSDDPRPRMTRRAVLGTSIASIVGVPASAGVVPDPDFGYEVRPADTEWRTRLTEEEYGILRRGNTEWPKTSRL